jgi:hypothetical protein
MGKIGYSRNKKLVEAVQTHIKKLQGSLDRQTDVIGYAVAINGKEPFQNNLSNFGCLDKLSE